MPTANNVARLLPSNFKNIRGGQALNVSIGSTGNAVVAIPLSVPNSSWVLGKVRVWGNSGAAASAIIQINTANDGTGNLTDGTTAMGNLTATGKFQDLVLTSGAGNTVQTANILYVKVGTAATGVTINIDVHVDYLK